MRENKPCPDYGWSQMPTEELDKILQAELEKEHPNEEVVLPILEELEEREKDYPVEKLPEVLTILDQFSKHETTSKQSRFRRGWLAGVAALVAVACIVVMAIPRPAKAENLFDILFRWTESIFEFFTPEQDAENPPVDIIFETDNPGLQQLYDKVTKLGVEESVVPMWLPDGFVLSDLIEFALPDGYKVHGKFEKGNQTITITYRIATEVITSFEKEDTGVEVFEFFRVSHFIVENDENYSVTWMVDGVECLLSVDITKEDLYETIKSIYRSNLLK